ncbi:MAG: hypothetical protein ACI4HI_18125 [Lachnospiraceae bacterium]
MNKKMAVVGTVSCLAVFTVVGSTFAIFRTSTEGNAGTALTEITTKSIDISLEGEKKDQVEITKAAVPGAEYACKYNLKNNVEKGKTAYPVYARVKVYKQWEDPQLDASAVELGGRKETGEFVSYEKLNGQKQTENGWIIADQDEEELILYYTKPLKQGESTTDFLDTVKLKESLTNRYTDQKLNIKFEVTAIQSDLGTEAIESEWGVFAHIAADGTIQSISETRS